MVAAPASAQSPADSATAQALFERGKQLVKDGKYAEACQAFEESQRIEPRSGTLLNLAVCYEQAGRLASAWTTFLDAAALAKANNSPERESAARKRASTLVDKVSKLEIGAPFAASTPGLVILRDGVQVGSAQLGLPIPVDAGEHTITASAPGRKPWKSQVTVEAGARTATIRVPELESVSPEASPPEEKGATAPPAREPSNVPATADASPSRFTTGVIIGGVATGALAIGTVITGVLYRSKNNEYERANDALEPNSRDLRDSTRTLGVVNLALLGGTVVAAGVTTFLLIRGPSKESAGARVHLRAQVSPVFAGVLVGGSL